MSIDKDLLDATAIIAAAVLAPANNPNNTNLTPAFLHQMMGAIGDGLRPHAAKVSPAAVAVVAASALRGSANATPAYITATIKAIATSLAQAASATGDAA